MIMHRTLKPTPNKVKRTEDILFVNVISTPVGKVLLILTGL